MKSRNSRWAQGFLIAACLAQQVWADTLSSEQQKCLAKAHRFERHGWIYLHVEGEAKEIGFQHGYLLASEIAEGLRVTKACWEYNSAMNWPWLVERAAKMFVPHIDAENLAELQGIADGMTAAGKTATRDEIVAYNGIIEINGYWWPTELKKIKDGPPPALRESCSSFIATGNMTRDGNVVLGHNTMMDYNDVLPNVIEDILPARGHRILWQTEPGWIHSGQDFFITDAGLVGSETTIGGFEGFETNGVPEFVRMRRATQDASSIDQWCEVMRQGNNGGYANAWLLGDINSREIARLELGLREVAFEKKRDGYFTGSNVAENLKILRFETDTKETDIRSSSIARRVRWKQLMKKNTGHLDLAMAKEFEADHFDSYLGKVQAGGRSLCGHYELQAEPAGSWPGVPYGCSGTVDAKVVDASMAQAMSFAARWGTACGRAFAAHEYLTEHPQFDWMEGILSKAGRVSPGHSLKLESELFMTSLKQLKSEEKSAALQQQVIFELNTLVKDIERGEKTLSALKQELGSVNTKYQGPRTTREDIAYLTGLLECAKKKLAWEKQIASLQKRTPLLMEKMTAVMADTTNPPGPQTCEQMHQALRLIQSAMGRLQGAEPPASVASDALGPT